MKAWYIDSVDGVGGAAFASYREPDLGRDSIEHGHVFLASPDFAPQSVDNMSLVWGATRGAFQLGMVVDGKELAFPSLNALSAFVSRLYLGGAAGGPSSSGGPPPAPEGGGPRPSPEDGEFLQRYDFEEGRSIAREGSDGIEPALEFLKEAKNFKAASVETLSATWFLWTNTAGLSGESEPGLVSCDSLVSAAAALIIEMLQRMPAPGILSGPDRYRWLDSAKSLSRVIDGMGLWPLLVSHLARDKNLFQQWIRTVASKVPPTVEVWGWETKWRNQFLLEASSYAETWIVNAREMLQGGPLWSQLPSWEEWARARDAVVEIDPLTDLDTFPAPRDLESVVPSASDGGTSLRQLLYSVLSTPDAMITSTVGTPPRAPVAELALFAAAVIVLPSLPRDGWEHFHLRNAVMLDRARDRAERVTIAACNWLAGNLPQWVFAQSVEDIFRDAQQRKDLVA